MEANASPARSWVKAEALRQTLVDAAKTLEPTGVDLLAIKGIYMVHALGIDPAARNMLDADAVVIGGSFGRAVRLLVKSGAWTATPGWSAKAMIGPRGGVLDLHRLTLPLFFGRMQAGSLRRRATRHPAFEGRVLTPDAEDAACIALAHFVKDCLGQKGHGGLSRDLAWLAERADVKPLALAERLREHGLRRAGMLAFTSLANTDHRWEAWLAALGPSRGEQVANATAVRVLERHGRRHPDLAFLLVRSLGDDVTRGVFGFAATAARLVRDRAMRSLETDA